MDRQGIATCERRRPERNSGMGRCHFSRSYRGVMVAVCWLSEVIAGGTAGTAGGPNG